MWYLVTIEVTFWLPLCPQFELITASALQFHRLDALWIG